MIIDNDDEIIDNIMIIDYIINTDYSFTDISDFRTEHYTCTTA